MIEFQSISPTALASRHILVGFAIAFSTSSRTHKQRFKTPTIHTSEGESPNPKQNDPHRLATRFDLEKRKGIFQSKTIAIITNPLWIDLQRGRWFRSSLLWGASSSNYLAFVFLSLITIDFGRFGDWWNGHGKRTLSALISTIGFTHRIRIRWETVGVGLGENEAQIKPKIIQFYDMKHNRGWFAASQSIETKNKPQQFSKIMNSCLFSFIFFLNVILWV